ncbi:hypothetical protein E5985_10415 [Muribaculaceae bacterium]|nr:hypothetical protein E5985_10415 [Muribaculaceae bacterium]
MRFPEFCGEWKETTLGKISEITKGSGISKDQLSEQGSPCILYGELYTKYKSEIIDEAYSRTELDSSSLVKSKANDVIIPCSGETAIDISTARCVSFNNILLGGDLNIIRLKHDDGGFFAYQLNGARKKDIARVAQGVSVVHLYGENLKHIRVYHPAIEEQKKITRLLSLIDERITTQNKIIEKLQSLISGLNDFLHLQVGGLSTSFEELGTSYSGLSGKSGDDFGKGKPYITYLNIYSNSIVNKEQVDYVVIGDNEKQNTLLYGDLLFTLSSETPDEVGIGAVYLGESDKYYLNSFCFGLHMTATNKVYSPYLAYLVSNSVFRKFIYPLAQGSTRFNLQKNDFMKKKFSLPTFESQKEIARTLNALSSKLETERKLLLNYQEQKQYLLGSMFI